MSPTNPIFALACLLPAVAAAFLLVKKFGDPTAEVCYASIDGLRGYLAFFVFIHHSCVWYFYQQTGRWGAVPSNLYHQLGEGSVALFFMITSFLFFGKLMDSKNVGWLKLYVGRVFRLTPLYLFAMLLFFAVIFTKSGKLNEPLPQVAKECAQWIAFCAHGSPDINGVRNSFIAIAGVVWTLRFEWVFYFSLPLLAMVSKKPILALVCPVLCIAALTFISPSWAWKLAPFIGGMVAAILVRSERVRVVAKRKASALAATGCVAGAFIFCGQTFAIMPIMLLGIAFVLIACGNDLFGLLTHPVSRMLGAMSYSIYLLHGIYLFLAYRLSGPLSPVIHWLIPVAIAPAVVFGSYAAHRWIEKPGMRLAPDATDWIKGFIISVSVAKASQHAEVPNLPDNKHRQSTHHL